VPEVVLDNAIVVGGREELWPPKIAIAHEHSPNGPVFSPCVVAAPARQEPQAAGPIVECQKTSSLWHLLKAPLSAVTQPTLRCRRSGSCEQRGLGVARGVCLLSGAGSALREQSPQPQPMSTIPNGN